MKKTGFTLVEILIVVIILGILAAIVIPQFTSASESAKESNLKSDLLTLRNQCELYRVQHGDNYPWEMDSATAETVVTQLTVKTNSAGDTSGSDLKFGPYLDKMPTNLFVKDAGGAGAAAADQFKFGAASGVGDGATGWYIDTDNNRIYPNSNKTKYPEHADF